MACLRFDIQVAIPASEIGTTILADEFGNGGITLSDEAIKTIREIRGGIQKLKKLSRKINEGLPNEENTVRAIYRICYHDEGEGHPPCEPEQDI